MTASNAQVARLLSLVPYLLHRPGVRLDEVAREFRVTPEQLRKDLSVLYMCGLPGLLPGDLIEIDMEVVDGSGVIFLSNADFLGRPLRFTPDEVVPLILGLRTIRELASGEVAGSVESALSKLEAAAGESAQMASRVSVRVDTAEEPVRRAIAEAQGAGVRLRLTYDSASRGHTTTRLVDPQSIQVRDGYAYLEAWSEVPQEVPEESVAEQSGGRPVERTPTAGWRSFRLDRIVAAEATDIPAVDHPEQVSSEHWLERAVESTEVTLEVTARGRWVAEYHPTLAAAATPDGGLVIRLRVVDPGWLRGLLLRLGPDLVRVSPPSAAEPAVRSAADALGWYETAFGAGGRG